MLRTSQSKTTRPQLSDLLQTAQTIRVPSRVHRKLDFPATAEEKTIMESPTKQFMKILKPLLNKHKQKSYHGLSFRPRGLNHYKRRGKELSRTRLVMRCARYHSEEARAFLTNNKTQLLRHLQKVKSFHLLANLSVLDLRSIERA